MITAVVQLRNWFSISFVLSRKFLLSRIHEDVHSYVEKLSKATYEGWTFL